MQRIQALCREHPDPRAINTAKKFGVDISKLRGRQFSEEDFDSIKINVAELATRLQARYGLSAEEAKAQADEFMTTVNEAKVALDETPSRSVSRPRLWLRLGHAAAAGVVLLWLFPVYWVVLTSFKPIVEINSAIPSFVFEPTLENYRDLFAKFEFAGVRFGLDAIIGLIPVLGDSIAALIGLYPIYVAQQHKLGLLLRARMLLNLIIDWLIGIVPFIGDIADVAFKANIRNAKILRTALEKRSRS